MFIPPIYQITDSIWQGAFASPKQLPHLREVRTTHILNVGEGPSVLTLADGPFSEIVWYPIVDLERIDEKTATDAIDTLHRMVIVPESRTYIHCVAGMNRSPTVLWLYFLACGMEPTRAKELINAKNADAIPGHARLVDDQLVVHIRVHGKRFLSHP
jgi:protein-tyrosine phosphatase